MAFQPVVQKLFSALQSGDGPTADHILGSDVQSDALIGPVHGSQAVIEFANSLMSGFSSAEFSLVRVIEDNASAVAEFRFKGLHDRHFDYGPVHIWPTGRPVTMAGSLVADFASPVDEIMSRVQVYWNWLACLAQLGIRPHMRADPVAGARGKV